MAELPTILLYIFLISTMLAIGLGVSGGEILAALNSRQLITKALIANLIVIPLIGVLITKVIDLEPPTIVAILLAAAAPGGLRALQFTGKVKDHIYFAAGLMLLLTVIAIVITPLLVSLMVTIPTPYTFPYGRLVLFVFLILFLPLAVGHFIRRKAASLATSLSRPMLIVSNLSFIATAVRTLAINKQATQAIGKKGVAAMLVLIVAGLVIGWLFGGPNKGIRRVRAVNTSMRNVALCLVIATRAFSDSDVEVAVLAFAALMVPPNMLFTLYHGIKTKRAEKALASS